MRCGLEGEAAAHVGEGLGVFCFHVVEVVGVAADIVRDRGQGLAQLLCRGVVALHQVVKGDLGLANPAATDRVDDALQAGELALDFIIGTLPAVATMTSACVLKV